MLTPLVLAGGLGGELKTGRFVATIGGGAVITATAASRLGLRTAVISGLSRQAIHVLRRERVTAINVRRPSEPHAVTVALSTSRDRSFVTFNGVNARLQPRLPAALARRQAAHVHFAFSPDRCDRRFAIVALHVPRPDPDDRDLAERSEPTRAHAAS